MPVSLMAWALLVAVLVLLAHGVLMVLVMRRPGPVGPQGPPGADGPKGDPGPRGAVGATGPSAEEVALRSRSILEPARLPSARGGW